MTQHVGATVILPRRQPFLLPLRFLGGVLLAVILTLVIFVYFMRPPMGEFWGMTLFLSVTALISLLAGYVAYRLGLVNRSPRLSWTLLASYFLASLLTFLNVWVTARLMFINQHDLTLATILLVFAAGIAVALGYFLTAAITDNISALNRGAQRIADGHFDTRVGVSGRDEMSELARSFNTMAAQLDSANQEREALETLRRELIAWVGHDLRTPLASVRAIVEALADGVVEDPETAARYLNTAKRDISALSSLIDDLFEMAQIDAGGIKLRREMNAISDMISDTLESFSGKAKSKSIQLIGEAAPGVDPVYIDARQIERVLTNLVDNALRHTPEGGTVEVSVRPYKENVLVQVTDSGEGIQQEDLPYVFDQFYRGEKSRSRTTGGAGLGLAIARGIVEAHGGRIRVESESEVGTRFSFILPKEES